MSESKIHCRIFTLTYFRLWDLDPDPEDFSFNCPVDFPFFELPPSSSSESSFLPFCFYSFSRPLVFSFSSFFFCAPFGSLNVPCFFQSTKSTKVYWDLAIPHTSLSINASGDWYLSFYESRQDQCPVEQQCYTRKGCSKYLGRGRHRTRNNTKRNRWK